MSTTHDPPGPRPRETLLRLLPKIDELAGAAGKLPEAAGAQRWALVAAARQLVEERRQVILAGQENGEAALAPTRVVARARALAAPSLRRVINATGVVLHTNLGRAPLGATAVARIAEVARGYCNLEYELGAGERGERHGHVRAALCALTGAEDAVAVNNGAAAVMLGIAALAGAGDGERREVVVSRGELVEIGGAFRVPDIMQLSGATLVEVGTTNKTHATDYTAAIGPRTAMLLKVHRSNFAMIGFTAEVDPAALVAIGRAHGLPVMMDLGSGLLGAGSQAALGLAPTAPGPEPTLAGLLADGVELIACSGDKLLGGPQAGLLLGRAAAVERARRHPLMRALRPDKLVLAALEATLAAYRDGRAAAEVPIVAMLSASPDDVRRRAEAVLVAALAEPAASASGRLSIVPSEATVGGGCLPLAAIPSWAIAVAPIAGCSAADLDAALRAGAPPIIGRIADGALLLDARTISDDEISWVAAALRAIH